jgi:hypothetical protein
MPESSQNGSVERRITTRRWRIAVERIGWMKHRWTVEEEWINGRWKVKGNGATFTRRGAIRQARRMTYWGSVFRIDRHEEIIATQESYVPDRDRDPDVRAELLEALDV